MRILLVSPRTGLHGSTPEWTLIPQMSLLILAALSGDNHEVVIVEEEREPIPFEEEWDLVGISIMTATAPRGYAVAKRFRERGAKVILGGIHASTLPEEAGQHADAVLVGEAENVWPQIVGDAERGTLQPIYENLQPEPLQVPVVTYQRPKKAGNPVFAPVITSRGCPYGCEFCSVARIYGKKIRPVPVATVVEQIRRCRSEYVAILDDNLAGNREHALEIFAALKDLHMKLLVQVHIKFILDEELFSLAVAAGLKGVLVGFETIDGTYLKGLRKAVALDEYKLAIRKCRAARVWLHGSFIFGLDEHDPKIFGRTLEFVLDQQIPSVNANLVTPYPGTPFFERLRGEGRLLHTNWLFYDHLTPVFQPQRLTIEELVEGLMKFRTSLYGWWGMARRLPTGLAVNLAAFLHVNAAYRQTTAGLKQYYKKYFGWLRHQDKAFVST